MGNNGNGTKDWIKQNASLPNLLLILSLVFTAGTTWNRVQALEAANARQEAANSRLAERIEEQSRQLTEAGRQQTILVWQVQALSEQMKKIQEALERKRVRP